MATVTVVTAERTLEIEATSIVDGTINAEGHLILTRHDGTPLDMGAVSGVQVHNGTVYAKADVFSYVGATDPGAVPNGSVWYDTNDVAGPLASETQKGLVELATNAETIAGTDNSRAVTPASLAAVPGNKVQILAPNAITETSSAASYPLGISQMTLTTSSGWSVNSGFGSVITYRTETDRTVQHFYGNPGGTGTPRMWQRQFHTSNNGGGWTAWSQSQLLYGLTPGTLVQTSPFTSYPAGWSRMYFTSANSTGWDFAGSYGELLTYQEGGDFAKQTWTLHTNGGGGPAEMWIRTANSSGGWSAWRKFITDPGGWTAYTPTWTSQGSIQPSLGNAVVNCKSHKMGRKVEVTFEITFGSTTNFGSAPTTSDNWQFSLPYPAANSSDSIGFLELRQTNDKSCMGKAKLYSTTGFRVSIIAGYVDGTAITNSGDVDSISPFVWASGNSVKGSLTYEAAS